MRKSPLLLIALAPVLSVPGPPSASAGNPIDVGAVEWRRDFDAVLEESRRTGVPVFALFQEVPGCSGCRRFGSEVMSHPPIVQAVEREFLPVLIYNNRRGRDAELLERFREPAWNYQVVRFLDGTGEDLIPRKDRVWSRDGIARRMIEALRAAGRDVPPYLEIVAYEGDAENHRTAVFAQHCFWTGEVKLGRISGVITTEAGWFDGREVTRVRYHRGLISLERLIEEAAPTGAADAVYLAGDDELRRAKSLGVMPAHRLTDAYRVADVSDQKKQIGGSVFARIKLSPMQRTKINADAPLGIDEALTWLPPDGRPKIRAAMR